MITWQNICHEFTYCAMQQLYTVATFPVEPMIFVFCYEYLLIYYEHLYKFTNSYVDVKQQLLCSCFSVDF